MAKPELVLARSKRTQRVAPMSRVLAERVGAEILDESPYRRDRTLRPMTTKTGRAVKPRTTVAEAAAKSTSKADEQAVTESATNKKENDQ